MNFYKHHLGDYDADTSHLSWAEDMAYTRLLRLYYRREKPIPSDVNLACRLVRASTRKERDAVGVVLAEFFTLCADGWRNKRADEEIENALEKAEKNRESGKLGGRRPKNPLESTKPKSVMVSESKPNALVSPSENNPSQTPDSRLQTPDKYTDQEIEQAYSPPPPKVPKALDWSSWPSMPSDQIRRDWLAMRKAKKAPINQTVINTFAGEMRKAAAMGYSVDQCLAECITSSWQGFKAEWIANRNKTGGTNGKPERISHFERVARDAERHIAELDRLDRLDAEVEQRDRAIGDGAIPPGRLVVSVQGG